MIHSVLRIEKKFSAGALSSGLPALDIEGKMLYSGVCPTCTARSFTCVLTVSNILANVTMIASVRSCLSQSVKVSNSQPIRLGVEQPGQERHEYQADKGDAAPRHELLHAL